MARVRTHHGFTALKTEGGMLPPDFLHAIAMLQAPYQASGDYGLSKSLRIKDEISRYWRIANDLHDSLSSRRYRRGRPLPIS
ncbi:MAG: hypothetical protein OXC68_15745 [Aestuariivita sp.]|nr:hypothetical protein [Aestuariivita sp.]